MPQSARHWGIASIAIHEQTTTAAQIGLKVEIHNLPDPRVEAEEHYYNAKNSKLIDLGLEPHFLSTSLLDSLINIAVKYRDRIETSFFMPRVNWRTARNEPRQLMRSAASGVSISPKPARPVQERRWGFWVWTGPSQKGNDTK